MLEDDFQVHNGIGIDPASYSYNFTFVTDRASVMAQLAGSSVNARVAYRNIFWLVCAAHMINTSQKGCISSLKISDIPELRTV